MRTRQDVDATWCRLIGIHSLVDHVEAHLGCGAEKLAQCRRILEAWKLDEDAVGADALDQRLGNTDGIDALTNDFQALLNRLGGAVGEAGLGHGDRDGVAILGDRDIGSRAAKAERASRGSQLFKLRQNLLAVGSVFDLDRHGVAGDAGRRSRNAFGAQRPTRIVE
ncbi:hypothetical protein D9M72_472910 [compost metagenome]